MANLNKELKKLFFKSLARQERDKYQPRVLGTPRRSPMYPSQRLLFSGQDNDKIGIIFFYEWSDVSGTPKTFYTLAAFEKFLNECEIYLLGWQREVLSNIHNPYVACKKGEKDLVIKNSYDKLKEALTEGSTSIKPPFPHSSNKGSEDVLPYNVAITRPPSMRHMEKAFEPEGRWPQNGGWWDW